MPKYNNWAPWHPLKAVMLGDCYPTSFYNDVASNRIRSALQRITEETQEDLENYRKVLVDYGCEVIRPYVDQDDSITNYLHKGKVIGKQGVPRSPLQPRDGQVVIGSTMYYTMPDHFGIKQVLDTYNDDWVDLRGITADDKRLIRIQETYFDLLKGADWLTYQDYLRPDYFEIVEPHIAEEVLSHHKNSTLPGASVTVVGKDVYVDTSDNQLFQNQEEKLLSDWPIRINKLATGGHSDGCFHVMKPGAIISILNVQEYAETFPGWDVCYLPEVGWGQVEGFLKMKEKVKGKWWVPGEEDNDEFTAFVETWLNEWVGFAEESVFDVNVLCLDDKHVVVNNYNEEAFAFFKKHKIEPIISPFRHRYFWDGGLHCVTLDLYREGVMEDYFPTRDAKPLLP